MKVSVKTFKEQIAMLKHVVNVEFKQCVNEQERKSTVKVLKSLASDLTEMECKRADEVTLLARDMWLTKSADICARYFNTLDSMIEEVLSCESMKLV